MMDMDLVVSGGTVIDGSVTPARNGTGSMPRIGAGLALGTESAKHYVCYARVVLVDRPCWLWSQRTKGEAQWISRVTQD
jgi:hypothetical protein